MTNPRDPGEVQLPAPTNHPGGLMLSGSTIDNNDNIWFTSTQRFGELWMFDTTSWMFVRMQGLYGSTNLPSVGADPGQPGEDVWPGLSVGTCVVTDSQSNIWFLSGENYYVYTPSVWHFNTTSLLWTWISGDVNANYASHNDTYFGGTSGAGCYIDTNDRVWLYGGWGFDGDFSTRKAYGSIWTYDTRTTRDWELEYFNAEGRATIVSEDYDAGNIPPACESCIYVDRLDGTAMLVPGQGYENASVEVNWWGGRNWVWLYNKSLKQWKHVNGNGIADYPGTFTNYREPGSDFHAAFWAGGSRGKNSNGDVYVVGGSLSSSGGPAYKDIWIIPQEQCSNDLYTCDVNADCVEEIVGYSCQCKEGYTGDGKTCTFVPPVAPVASPVAAPESVATPQSETPTSTPAGEPMSPNTPSAAPKGNNTVAVPVISLILFISCGML